MPLPTLSASWPLTRLPALLKHAGAASGDPAFGIHRARGLNSQPSSKWRSEMWGGATEKGREQWLDPKSNSSILKGTADPAHSAPQRAARAVAATPSCQWGDGTLTLAPDRWVATKDGAEVPKHLMELKHRVQSAAGRVSSFPKGGGAAAASAGRAMGGTSMLANTVPTYECYMPLSVCLGAPAPVTDWAAGRRPLESQPTLDQPRFLPFISQRYCGPTVYIFLDTAVRCGTSALRSLPLSAGLR